MIKKQELSPKIYCLGLDNNLCEKIKMTLFHEHHTHQSNPFVHTLGHKTNFFVGKDKEDKEETENDDTWNWMTKIEDFQAQWHTFGSNCVTKFW